MPFDGSAIARTTSAEFIAASRQRARSLSNANAHPAGNGSLQAASVYDANAPSQLFMIPAPIYGIPRSDDECTNTNGSRPKRSLTGLSLKSKAPAEAAIPEAPELDVPEGSRPAQTAQSSTVRPESNEASERSETETLAQGSDRDVERGERDGLVVGKPNQFKTRTGQKENLEKQEKTGPPKEEKDPYLVTLEGRPHLNPHTWNSTYRWALTGFAGLLVLNASFASSATSQVIVAIDTYFNVSEEVGTLTIALFVAGYCVGPIVWGPLSERFGRKWIFILGFVPYTGFQVGCALSPNIGSLLVFRFLSGCFASSPLTNSGGLIADLWDADQRGVALAIFSLAPFAGPALAPIVSGILAVKNISWRWMFWILTIFAGVCLAAIVFLLPETYVPYMLHKEAKRIRKETGDDRYHSANEHPDHKVTLKETLHHTVLKPFIMIAQEPMLLLLTLYLSFVYGIVYLLFEALPIVFQEEHGFNALEGGLVFLALPIGGLIAVVIYALYFNKIYAKKHKAIAPRMVPPEERLKPLMVASPLFALAFFWFGWTYYKSINPASPILAVTLLGSCILWMFLSIFNYLIDAYLSNAASALAINTVCRSAFGAGFPLFATQMYDKLGTPGASSLLGGLAIVFIPVPFLLYKYGKQVRSYSTNAAVLD